jgi:predicted NUDIX family NTP pyrophosphohydrolase
MPKQSAGILLFRRPSGPLEFFLVHPGGPFWKKKDDSAWSIPKGEFDDEDPFEAAKREFAEETGESVKGLPIPLGCLAQPSGKIVHAWAVEQDFNPANLRSNTFELEWPPKSGRIETFPEVDRGEWFPLDLAKRKILKGQLRFLEQVSASISVQETHDSPQNRSPLGEEPRGKHSLQLSLFDKK